MANLRQINFGGQGQQQIAQQQSPKSIMAQLLLQRAGQRDNTAGAGIRSAGENILGALLKKQAFEEQQDRLANQQANMADTIKGLFPEGTVDRSIPSGPGLPDVDERIMRDLPIQESDVGAPDPLGVAQLFDTAQSNAAGGFNTTPPIPEEGLQVGQQFQGKSQKAIDFANQPVEFQESVPNQLGQMLQSFNRGQPGGIAPGAVFGVAQQQQAQQAEAAEAKRLAIAKIEAAKQKQRDAIALKKVRSGDFKAGSDQTTNIKDFLFAEKNPKFKDFIRKTGLKSGPAAIAEFEFFESLKNEDGTPDNVRQSQFMALKKVGTKSIDLGDRVIIPDPVDPSGTPRASFKTEIPPEQQPNTKLLQEKAKVLGGAEGEALVKLPKTIATATLNMDTITKAIEHPGLNGAVGVPNFLTFGGFVPGTNEANFRTVAEQLEGQVFLEAFEALKGAGQITEEEGRQATRARARLGRTQDEVEYRKSLMELHEITFNGTQRARKAANPDYQIKGYLDGVSKPKALDQRVWDAMPNYRKRLFRR